jgi:hypothetical protein
MAGKDVAVRTVREAVSVEGGIIYIADVFWDDELLFQIALPVAAPDPNATRIKQLESIVPQQCALAGQRIDQLFSEQFIKRAHKDSDWERQIAKIDEAFQKCFAAMEELKILRGANQCNVLEPCDLIK